MNSSAPPAPQEENIAATDKLAFQSFAQQVANHPACQHNLFAQMRQKAEQNNLTAQQVDLFTRAMMARIFRTIPNIAGLVQTGLLKGDTELAQTAMHNLAEEMGMEHSSSGKTHQKMAEDAFNSLRRAFGLPHIGMKEAHDQVPLPESYAQEQLWLSGYRDFPAIASWLQERASGGQSDNQQGMMGDMFALFEACRDKIGQEDFKSVVLPYFQSHNQVVEENGHYRIVFDPNAVEFQHGARAERDALREYAATPADKRPTVQTMATAFLGAQSQLFDAIQGRMQSLSSALPQQSRATAAAGL